MYVVQALIPDMNAQELDQNEWTDVHTVGKERDEITELSVARERAVRAKRFYVNVRIIWRVPGGTRKVVR